MLDVSSNWLAASKTIAGAQQIGQHSRAAPSSQLLDLLGNQQLTAGLLPMQTGFFAMFPAVCARLCDKAASEVAESITTVGLGVGTGKTQLTQQGIVQKLFAMPFKRYMGTFML